MTNLPTPQDLEIMAVKAGISMSEACRRAKVSPAVFHRWKRGADPGLERVRKIVAELRAAMPKAEKA
jgi:predicted transcriptional regulator